MTAEQKLVDRYNEGSDDALTERYAGARVVVNADVGDGKLVDTHGAISHFESGYVIIGGFEGEIDMHGFPVEMFASGEIRFES